MFHLPRCHFGLHVFEPQPFSCFFLGVTPKNLLSPTTICVSFFFVFLGGDLQHVRFPFVFSGLLATKGAAPEKAVRCFPRRERAPPPKEFCTYFGRPNVSYSRCLPPDPSKPGAKQMMPRPRISDGSVQLLFFFCVFFCEGYRAPLWFKRNTKRNTNILEVLPPKKQQPQTVVAPQNGAQHDSLVHGKTGTCGLP